MLYKIQSTSKQTHFGIGLNEVRILQTKFEFGKENTLTSLIKKFAKMYI